MHFTNSIFGQILKEIPRRKFAEIVKAHNGDCASKGFKCRDQLAMMLYAQLGGFESIRRLEASWNAHPGHHYHAGSGKCRRSTLADANALRPAAIYGELLGLLVARLPRKMRREGNEMVRLLDATPIPLRQSFFDWAEADSRIKGLKVHVVYDPSWAGPERTIITSPKVNDVVEGRKIPLERGVTYVFDKGYCDYGWWRSIHEAGAFFVTRRKENAHIRVLRVNEIEGAGILSDRHIHIGHRNPRAGAVNRLYDTPVREITVSRENKGKPCLILLTNDLTRTAEEIASLYRGRWEIELFFKWLKQNLKIRKFIGRNENAVKIQILTAMIAYVLLALVRHKSGLQKVSTLLLATVIGGNLHTRKPLYELLRPPDKKSAPNLSPHCQQELPLCI